MAHPRLFARIRPQLLFALASGILLAVAFEQYQTAQEEAAVSQQRLQKSRQQAAEITQMRDRPAFAATAMEDVSALTTRIAGARRTADIAAQAVDLVDPRSPQRSGDSPYLLRPVAINLRGLRLPQVVQFTAALTDRQAGMWVNQLRLAPVRRDAEQDEPELWNVDLTLTQVVFSPKTP